jgi:methylated-DNA-[protein]-cysteine S-methyltransferase
MQDNPTGSASCPLFVSGTGINSRPRSYPPAKRASEVHDTALIATPFGWLSLSAQDGFLTDLDFVMEAESESIPPNSVLESAALQLSRYFDDPATRFSLPLRLAGTDYTRRVWAALTEIPPGRTETYGSLARRLGSGPRAVAAACRANAFPILIPCHRVVAAHGLGGYCGQTSGRFLDIKRWLLKYEGCKLD